MNKKRFTALFLSMLLLIASLGVAAQAEEEPAYLYGMMNIPYADFYAAEGIAADTVDAVTTASTKKWGGSMTEGSYKTDFDAENGSYGAILGVTYAVAITEEDLARVQERLDALRAEATGSVMVYDGEGYNTPVNDQVSYQFTALEEKPAAYKVVSFDENGDICFSKIVGETYDIDESEYVDDLNVDVGENTSYGEYQLNWNVNNNNNFPVSGSGMVGVDNQTGEEVGIKLTDGTTAVFQLRGMLLVTDGANNGGEETVYAMRQMENIWVGARYGLELAWSAGVSKTVHGASILDTVHYASTMGETVKQVILIGDTGYYVFDWEVYLPYVLGDDDYSLSVEDGAVDAAEIGFTAEMPQDFDAKCAVKGLDASFETDHFHFRNAVPGSYTLTVSDNSGKYASVSAKFVLSTEVTPAQYDAENKAIVLAEGATQEELDNYLANISKVSVNGKDYSATGRGAVKVVGEGGVIDVTAKAFEGAGTYEIVIKATGYSTNLEFIVTVE